MKITPNVKATIEILTKMPNKPIELDRLNVDEIKQLKEYMLKFKPNWDWDFFENSVYRYDIEKINYNSNWLKDSIKKKKFLNVDNYIYYWHNHETKEKKLCKFLGITDAEYRMWLQYGNDFLHEIINVKLRFS